MESLSGIERGLKMENADRSSTDSLKRKFMFLNKLCI